MPHNDELMNEVTQWLKKTRTDLAACSKLLKGKKPLCDIAVFHAQQAAEKAIKAFLTMHSIRFGKTHNLVEIGKQAVGIDATLESLLRRASMLSQYALKY